MSDEQKKTHWFRRGVMIGVVAGSILLVSNKKARRKVSNCVGDCVSSTKRWISVVKENREPFIEQLKASSEKISSIVEDASEDIEKLVESSQHMKSHTQEMLKTLQETKEDFQTLTKQLKGEETVLVEEVLPASNENKTQ